MLGQLINQNAIDNLHYPAALCAPQLQSLCPIHKTNYFIKLCTKETCKQSQQMFCADCIKEQSSLPRGQQHDNSHLKQIYQGVSSLTQQIENNLVENTNNFTEVMDLLGTQFKYDYWASFSDYYKYMEDYINNQKKLISNEHQKIIDNIIKCLSDLRDNQFQQLDEYLKDCSNSYNYIKRINDSSFSLSQVYKGYSNPNLVYSKLLITPSAEISSELIKIKQSLVMAENYKNNKPELLKIIKQKHNYFQSLITQQNFPQYKPEEPITGMLSEIKQKIEKYLTQNFTCKKITETQNSSTNLLDPFFQILDVGLSNPMTLLPQEANAISQGNSVTKKIFGAQSQKMDNSKQQQNVKKKMYFKISTDSKNLSHITADIMNLQVVPFSKVPVPNSVDIINCFSDNFYLVSCGSVLMLFDVANNKFTEVQKEHKETIDLIAKVFTKENFIKPSLQQRSWIFSQSLKIQQQQQYSIRYFSLLITSSKDKIIIWNIKEETKKVLPYLQLKTNCQVSSICDLLDFNYLIAGDIQGELSI